MTRYIVVLAAVICAAFAVAPIAQAGTGTINVTPKSTGNSGVFSDFIILTLTAPDGSERTTFGSRLGVTSFTDLPAGTYEIFARDLGNLINEPREGSLTVTIADGETVDVSLILVRIPLLPFP